MSAIGLTNAELRNEIDKGGRFVVFPYTISLLIVTLSRNSDVTFVRAGESTFVASLPYLMLSLCFGWWGFPFGLIYTPISVFHCLAGGKDVTSQIVGRLASR